MIANLLPDFYFGILKALMSKYIIRPESLDRETVTKPLLIFILAIRRTALMNKYIIKPESVD